VLTLAFIYLKRKKLLSTSVINKSELFMSYITTAKANWAQSNKSFGSEVQD
jgi:hypothetical protein